jgi:amidophosphoribosyltransferase
LVRQAGVREVHLRIGSPPITHSCYYGIDTPHRSELIASTHTQDKVRDYLGVESLRHLSLEGLLSCVGEPDDYCVACFSGRYPVEPALEQKKGVFEDVPPCGEGLGAREETRR